ncbi:extracellular solute-binding protein [Roseovarius sp. 2305UL8-3]|uniref:extracellular solute-binding protein n=1 Tax=Roseovarius conchicola TaxID=3121636 RepID=UPI003528138D
MIQLKKNRLGGPIAGVAILAVSLCMAQAQESDGTPATLPAPVAVPEIVFTSWTGPYMRSQMLGFVRPYEAKTGARVHVEHYDGGIAEIRDQVESANVVWDVVDLTQADSLRACEEGLLEDLSDIQLPDGADGTPASEDFVPGALNDCGVGVIVWGTAFAHKKSAFGDNPPTTIADFFDTETYPGARAIRDDPTVIMEWALMADGVAREDVYPMLETEEGVERAFDMMDSIRPGLQLWSAGLEPARMLNSGEVAMSSIWATTGATASQKEGADFLVNMDGRVIELDLFGIPKGSRYKEEAIEFIRYASSTQALADMVSYLPNGPTRNSSLPLLSEETLAQIPNGPAYDDKAFIRSDAEWWAANHARLEEAFNIWTSAGARQGASGTVR